MLLMLSCGCIVVLLFVFWPPKTILPKQRKANATIATIFFFNFPDLLAGILRTRSFYAQSKSKSMLHGDGVHLSSLPQRVSKSLYSSAPFARPKAKHDPGEVNQLTVSDRAGRLAPW